MPTKQDGKSKAPFWTRIPLEYVLVGTLILLMLVAFLWSYRPGTPEPAVNPDSIEGRLSRADHFVERGLQDQAAYEYRKVLERDPGNFPAHLGLGNLYFTTGRYEAAEKEYQAALEVRKAPEAYVGLGLVHLERRQDLYAARNFREAVRIDPNSFAGNLQLGIALVRVDEPEEAVLHFRKAVQLDPTNLIALHNLGYALRLAGEPDKAVDVLELVVDKEPERAISLYELGAAYWESGRPEQALETLDRVLEVYPDHGVARELILEIERAGHARRPEG